MSSAQFPHPLSKAKKRKALLLASRAADLPKVKRQRFLEQRVGDDRVLLGEIQSLLNADLSRTDFLDSPPLRLTEPRLQGSLGSYRIVRQVGAGGMARVYLAERDDQSFKRRVAVKLLKRGMDSEDILQRFAGERQILANLNHPNIAQLHEGGCTEDGLPYFVMEYVEGLPILEHCKQRRLPLNERLRLFEKVCRAVQFAHQSMVIHRDLKPANILVTAEGEPKLLDFGIAKLLQPNGKGTVTRTDQRMCTPEYASPEQLLGGPLTTACDVYALGVLLFELLTGQRPFPIEKGRPSSLARVLGESAPPKPSATIGARPGLERLPKEAAHGVKGPERLRRMLRGDLDQIVLTALRREPQRRYASAGRMAEDIDRYLRGFPVSAVREAFGYKAGKWVRRHRWAVAGACLASLLVLLFAASALLQWRRAMEERARVQRVSQRLVEIFEAPDPFSQTGRPTGIGDFLELAVAKARSNLDEEPAVRGQLLATLGRMYMNLGSYREAEPLLKEAYAQKLTVLGAGHSETIAGLYDLGALALASGDYQEAFNLLTGALAASTGKGPKQEALRAKAQQKLAELHAYRGHFTRAAALLEQEGAAVFENIQWKINKAGQWRREGRFQAAEQLLRQVVAGERKLLGPTHPRLAVAQNQLANVLLDQACHEEAIGLYKEALATLQGNLGEQHPETATVRNNLGIVYKRLQRFGDAARHFERALSIRTAVLGPEHPAVAESLNRLARLHHELGDYQSALHYYDRLLDTLIELEAPNHPDLVVPLANLAKAYRDMEEPAAAEPFLTWGLEILDQTGEPDPAALWQTLKSLALLKESLGELYEAESLLKRMLILQESELGEDHPQTAAVLGKLACIYDRMGRASESSTLSAKAHMLAQKLPADALH